MAHSNTVLSQMLKLMPRHEFEKLANHCDGQRRSTALSRWSQFIALSVGHLGGRQSLRDIESCLLSQQHLHYHLGCQAVSKSSLARANYNRMKAAFKLHVGLDHDGLIPCFARVTTGRTAENEPARAFTAPPGSVVVFDKGYNNYQWHKSLTDKGIYWVSRIRGNAVYRVLERRAVKPGGAITSDQVIQYASPQQGRDELPPIRRVGYRDPQTGKHYVFITNHFNWSAQTIADIYKQRWQVELFFKWIKQNLKIKSFLGNSKNAVLTQVLVALCVYLLMAFIKFRSKVVLSLQQMKRLLQTNLFAKRCMRELFEKRKPDKNISPQFALALARR